MSVVQTLIAAGEGVAWPDAVTQTAIKLLVGRTRRRLRDIYRTPTGALPLLWRPIRSR